MFEKIKERQRQSRVQREQELQEKKQRLLSLSKKKLMVEILLELNLMNDQLENVENIIRMYSNIGTKQSNPEGSRSSISLIYGKIVWNTKPISLPHKPRWRMKRF